MKIYTFPSESAQKRLDAVSDRSSDFRKKDIDIVTKILNDVKKNGDRALIKYANRFDSPSLKIDGIRVTDKEIKDAVSKVDKPFIRTLNRAISNITAFHKQQKEKSWIDTQHSETILGRLVHPVDAAGVYVPGGTGGKTPLVSSVLMNVIPAQIAGVQKILMVTPPTKNGSVNPHLLAAAQKTGVTDIFKVGSAWAIAALTYGTETIPKVDVIVGPGNIYVTLAKKIVSGTVGIDMIAGPSEVLIIADSSANPNYIAADLLSQAEHDPLASAVLITDSEKTAKAVEIAVTEQVEKLERKEIARASLKSFGAIFVVDDLDTGFELSNRIAPEHFEVLVEDPFKHIGKIRNAGAVFIGEYTPEPIGDYIAGPNHVLPTSGTARFSSALSVDHFVKKTSLIYYSQKAFKRDAKDVIRLAEVEGLGAHANSVRIRM